MKRILSIITGLILLINLCPCLNAWAEDASVTNPYETIQTVTNGTPHQSTPYYPGGIDANKSLRISQTSVMFTTLDFSEGIQRLTLGIGGDVNTTTTIRIYIFPAGTIGVENSKTLKDGYTTINSYLKKDGSRIEPHYEKQITSGTYKDWGTPVDVTVDIPDGEKYKGLYDVLVGGYVKGGNLFSLRAESMVSKVELGAIFTDIDGNTTDNISEAAAIEASANGSIAACEEKDVELYLGVYDSDNNLLYKNYMPYIASSPETIKTGEIVMSAAYDNEAVMSDAAYAAVYMTIDGKLFESKYFGTKPSESAASESFSDEVSASANEGTVSVSGKADSSNSSVMVMMKDGANVLYMRSVPVNDGNYKCVFSPDVVTGTYDIIVTGNKKGVYTTYVDFVSYKALIGSMNNAQDVDSLYTVFAENEDTIGITLADSAGDSEWIFEQIYAKRGGIKNVGAAANMFNTYVALSAVNNGNPDKAVKEYSDILKISDSYKALYDSDESSVSTLRSAVSEYIAQNGKITEPEIFIEVLYDAIVAQKTMTAYKSYDFVNQPDKGGYNRVENGAIADLDTSTAYVKFANMDFETNIPKTIAVTYATEMVSNTAVWLCVDSKENVIKKLKTQNTGSWSNFITEHFVLTDTEAEKLSGVHDIYIMFKQKGDYKTLAFTNEYVDIQDFSLTCDSETVADITNITANTNGYIYNGQSNNVSLVSAAYDSNGSLIKSGLSGGTVFDNDSFNRSVTISDLSGAASVYAGIINIVNDKIIILKQKELSPITKTTAEQKNIAEVSNGVVYIYGNTKKASDVTLFVKKSTAPLSAFDEYALIYAVTADENGVFSYEFKMPVGFSSGDYDIIAVDSEGNNYKYTFNFASLEDYANVLKVINSASDAAQFKEYLNDPSKNEDSMDIAKILGLDLNVINGYPNPDKIYSEAFKYKNDGFKSAEDIVSAMKNSEFIYKLNNNIDMGSLYDTVKSNAKNFGIADSDIYTNYFIGFDSSRRTIFGQKLKELSVSAATVENLVDTINKAIVLTGFTNELSWGKIDGMFNSFADIFEEANREFKNTLSRYNALSETKKHTVCTNYIEKTGLTISEIASSFVKNYNNTVKTTSSSSSGGSGGSSSGRGTYPINAVSDPVTSTENQASDATAVSFRDLFGYDWAAEAISALAAKGIVEGRDEQTFDPASKVTREEFAALLIKAFDNTKESNASFTDVADNAWYKNYVGRAVEKNIVKGYPDGSFGVGKSITREDMCVMVRRAMSAYNVYVKDKNLTVAFIDMESAAEYAQEDIMALARMGIVSGTGNNSFSPKANTTRAEAAVIIYRVLGM